MVTEEEKEEEEEGEEKGFKKERNKTPRDRRHFYSFVCSRPFVFFDQRRKRCAQANNSAINKGRIREEIGAKTSQVEHRVGCFQTKRTDSKSNRNLFVSSTAVGRANKFFSVTHVHILNRT